MFDLDVPPTIPNALVIGLMAVIVIVLGKVILQKYHVPGLSELFMAA